MQTWIGSTGIPDLLDWSSYREGLIAAIEVTVIEVAVSLKHHLTVFCEFLHGLTQSLICLPEAFNKPIRDWLSMTNDMSWVSGA